MDDARVKYTTFDVMQDADIREMIKDMSKWNSFPQLYINKKFVGGLSFLEKIVEGNKLSNYIPTSEINL